ncbi:MAG: NADH-quinone oxidoreductase subunit J [bacterium]
MIDVLNAPDGGIVFWILSLVIILSGIMVVVLRNIFHCALFLIMCLFAVAGIYILLNAEFLAAAQVLIYVGGVAILIIFAVMLTTNLASEKIRMTTENAAVAFVACALFAVGSLLLLRKTDIWNYSKGEMLPNNVATIGKFLMTDFMLPFEVVSILLLAALIGAITLARKERS